MPVIAFSSARRVRNVRAPGAPSLASRTASAPTSAAAACARLELVGGDHRAAGHGQPEELQRQPHRVGREVARARPGPGTRAALQVVELGALELALAARADRLPDLLDRRPLAAPVPGAHRPAVDHDRGLVQARERHQRRRHGLVAADDADQRVEVVRDVHQLDRVRHQLARDQRRAHARRGLRLVVGDRDRVERQRDAARQRHALLDRRREVAVVEVARHRLRPHRRDADDRPVEALGVDPHRAEVRASARALVPVGQLGARPAPRRGGLLGIGAHVPPLSPRRRPRARTARPPATGPRSAHSVKPPPRRFGRQLNMISRRPLRFGSPTSTCRRPTIIRSAAALRSENFSRMRPSKVTMTRPADGVVVREVGHARGR